jgi:hypothetical protein
MQVQIEIGENHRFELSEALLIYRSSRTSFITKHEVKAQANAPPALGPAQPLTIGFIESLVRSLGGTTECEVFPPNILSKGDRMIVQKAHPCRRLQTGSEAFTKARSRMPMLDV